MDVQGQATVIGNSGSLGDFSGWDSGTGIPLDVRHDGNLSIGWFTRRVQRMRLSPDVLGPIGGFSTVNRDGYLLLSGQPDAFTNANSRAPFTRLHLIDPEVGTLDPLVYAQEIGFRPWQKNGVTFTGNSDQAYIGQKYKGDDNTDFVIQWSDNPDASQYGTDRMKFVFTTKYNPTITRGAQSFDGLEAMRFWPRTNFDVNVGVGDFSILGIDPTERFHVLDGRVRIQQLPDDPETDDAYKVMVVDDTNDPLERGVVKWKTITTAPTCDWTLNPFSQNNVSTAFGTFDADCPDATDAVGIGVDLVGTTPLAKLNVETDQFNEGQRTILTTVTATPIGGYFDVSGATNLNYGLFSNVHGGSQRNIGIWTDSDGATYSAWGGAFNSRDDAQFTWGAQGTVYGGSSTAEGLFGWAQSNADLNAGVHGRSFAGAPDATKIFYGVYGEASSMDPTQIAIGVRGSAPQSANSWAGYFQGDMHVAGVASCTGMIWGSDASIKTDIQPISGALGRIMQLQPSTYNFLVTEHPAMGLPTGQQRGLIAQEAMDVMPDIVSDIQIAPIVDSVGVQVYPGETIKGINYVALVPELIAAMQEQQAIIAQLQEQINNCCTAPGGMAPENGEHGEIPSKSMLQEQRLLIIPNPVQDLTRLEYYVPNAGKVSLQVSTSDGKPLATLREEMAQEGGHSYSWNTTALAAGTYFCTYILDGAVVVKRAIKVK